MKPMLVSLIVASPALFTSAIAGNVTSTWHTAAGGDWRTVAGWNNTPAISSYPANGGTTSFDVNFTASGTPYNVTLSVPLTLDRVTMNSSDANVTQSSGTVRMMNGMNLQAGTWTLNGGTLLNTTINQYGGG